MKHICKRLEHLQIQTTHKSILFQHSDLNKCKKKNVCSLQSSIKMFKAKKQLPGINLNLSFKKIEIIGLS